MLVLNPNKDMQHLYIQIMAKINTWVKWVKWRVTVFLGIGRLKIAKIIILPKLIYKFHMIPIKISDFILLEIDKIILKCI